MCGICTFIYGYRTENRSLSTWTSWYWKQFWVGLNLLFCLAIASFDKLCETVCLLNNIKSTTKTLLYKYLINKWLSTFCSFSALRQLIVTLFCACAIFLNKTSYWQENWLFICCNLLLWKCPSMPLYFQVCLVSKCPLRF